jgi:hypothetical protein
MASQVPLVWILANLASQESQEVIRPEGRGTAAAIAARPGRRVRRFLDNSTATGKSASDAANGVSAMTPVGPGRADTYERIARAESLAQHGFHPFRLVAGTRAPTLCPGHRSTDPSKERHPMRSTFAATVRIASRGNAVWRECAGCGVFAPLAPNESRCRACPVPARAGRRRAANARPTSERN